MPIKESTILCLSCAAIRTDLGRSMLVCPDCGFKVGRKRYDRLLRYARMAALYGHVYPERYRRDAAKGIDVRYYIELSDAAAFAAIAALSGVIGNASYDAIKAFIRRLREQGADPGVQKPEVKIFIQNVQEYHIERPTAAPTEEEIVYALVDKFAARLEQRGDTRIASRLRRANSDRRIGVARDRPSRRDFSGVTSRVKTPKSKKRR